MEDFEFIIYVKNQSRSKTFYGKLLDKDPILDEVGMTEFQLFEHVKLGIMPEEGIARIFKDKIPNPQTGNGIPRCELYLKVENPIAFLEKAIHLGATELSPVLERDWGDKAGYVLDFDGNIIGFAKGLS